MVVYLLALGAALLFGIGSVVQQRVAFDAPPGKSLRLSLLWWLVRQPRWLIGVGTALVGNLLAGAALGLGSVALVQPLLVSRLLFALPLSAAWMQQRLSRRDWGGAVATAGGLAAFIAVGQPEAGPETPAPLWRWAVAAVAIGAITLTLVVLARRLSPAHEAPMLGAGAGMLFGLQSGLTHNAVNSYLDDGLVALLSNWTTYTVAVTAVLGTLLAQSAYEMAPLPSSYPVLAAVEPLTGIGIGVGVLGGAISLGALPLTLELVGLAIMTGGILLLATSPLVTGQIGAMDRRQAEERAYGIEEQLRKDIARLGRDLRHLESPGAPSELSARGVSDHLDQVEEQLGALAALKMKEEPPESSPPQRERPLLPEHREAMDRWQQDIDAREAELREQAKGLRARVQALNTDT
ncbi:MAG TPA: DMT family transporter [Nocardioidaceae bacterium]|nr:DMT family transporter [Nocardioidaceae bacterium]